MGEGARLLGEIEWDLPLLLLLPPIVEPTSIVGTLKKSGVVMKREGSKRSKAQEVHEQVKVPQE